MIDWIAQAQLILAVGTKKTKAFREMNIRTIFDLEKVVFNPSLRRHVMKIMIPDATEAELNDVANATVKPALPWWNGQMQRGNSEVALDQHDALQALVALARDDLHVMRLRQIWDVIRMRLIQRPGEDTVVQQPRGARPSKNLAAPPVAVREAAD